MSVPDSVPCRKPDKINLKKEPDRPASAVLPDSCSSETIFLASNSSALSSEGICSSTDCTGLIPAMPSSEAELEAYEEMYPFCPVQKEP